nr:MAG TPA: hypothetical protein [Caudoviricetes sp.]DAO21022.1 MAG TPA: hypothetical protein [Caudoviricetes sp.]
MSYSVQYSNGIMLVVNGVVIRFYDSFTLLS